MLFTCKTLEAAYNFTTILKTQSFLNHTSFLEESHFTSEQEHAPLQ